jgi:hypothetical protein
MNDEIEQLKSMNREELDLVMYDIKKWICQAKGCMRGTHVRDYGITPYFFEHKKKGKWVVISTGENSGGSYLLCFKHAKFWDRLIKSFEPLDVYKKLIDRSCTSLEKMIDCKKNSYTNNKINI